MKRYLLISLLTAWSLYSVAQTTFQKAIGGPGDDITNSVQPTSDGGYILAGYTMSLGNGQNAYMVKLNSN